jgi:hypothetical protein
LLELAIILITMLILITAVVGEEFRNQSHHQMTSLIPNRASKPSGGRSRK